MYIRRAFRRFGCIVLVVLFCTCGVNMVFASPQEWERDAGPSLVFQRNGTSGSIRGGDEKVVPDNGRITRLRVKLFEKTGDYFIIYGYRSGTEYKGHGGDTIWYYTLPFDTSGNGLDIDITVPSNKEFQSISFMIVYKADITPVWIQVTKVFYVLYDDITNGILSDQRDQLASLVVATQSQTAAIQQQAAAAQAQATAAQQQTAAIQAQTTAIQQQTAAIQALANKDTELPTVTVKWDRGATITTSSRYTLYVIASDNSGGPLQMRVNGGAWQALSTNVSVPLSLGYNEVVVEVRDPSGNVGSGKAGIWRK